MLAVKARYYRGVIQLLEPIPAEIVSAELNIIVIPSELPAESAPAADACHGSAELEFKAIGLAGFADAEDDVDVDWEEHFGLN